MTQNKIPHISEVELPKGFEKVCTLADKIAISSDGRYAVIGLDGSLIEGQLPEDGNMDIDGTIINYHHHPHYVATMGPKAEAIPITGQSPIVINAQNVVIQNGNGYNLRTDYEGVKSIDVQVGLSTLTLGVSNDNKVYVDGQSNQEVIYKDGVLILASFSGKLIIPFSDSLEAKVHSIMGNINGDIAYPIDIATHSGDIILNMHVPLRVLAHANYSSLNMKGMKYVKPKKGTVEDSKIYLPMSHKPIGDVNLKATDGDICITYMKGV
jgi:hypothetical protein